MFYSPKIIIALDDYHELALSKLVSQLDPNICRLKVGKALFTRRGPALIQEFHDKGFEVFLDLKFHDIPQQVESACCAAAELGVWMLNVHALGGLAMLKAARSGVEKANVKKKPLLIGVTLLTSLSASDIQSLGIQGTPTVDVLRIAQLCVEANMDGVVCSAQEAPLIKTMAGKSFLCVTPGIRLSDEERHDQKRVVTPTQAILGGSDYLVMGRSITDAVSPLEKLQSIHQSICVL